MINLQAGKTLQDQLKTLKPSHNLVIVPPMFEVKMFGAQQATITPEGVVSIVYTDGETETRIASEALLGLLIDDITMCKLVGFVQSPRLP